MAKKVLIIGESGTGKSASMRNFDKSEILVINVARKDLPFRGNFEQIATDDYRTIKKAMQNTDKKVIVIDDCQYLMANEFMRRATEKGFEKFTEIAQNYWELQQTINALPDDVIVYEMSHLERDQNGNEKVKTIGKLLDEKITVEGMFSIVLKTVVTDGRYFFQTQNSGHDTCKSPIGLFKDTMIENDLKAVDTAIRDYYGLDYIEVVKEEVEVGEEYVKQDVKTTAEMMAAVQNNEPETAVQLPVETETPEKPKRKRRKAVTEE